MALFLLAGLIELFLRCVAVKDESRFPAIEDFEGFEYRTKHSSYLTIVLVAFAACDIATAAK